jgi:uncharacterized membrane protein YkoI
MNKIFLRMRRNFIPSVLLGGLLCVTVVFTDAVAGPCDSNQPCDLGPPGLLERLRQREMFTGEQFSQGAVRKRRKQRRIEISPEPSYYGDDDQFVQTYEADQGLIGPTEALTQALAAVPGGKALGVKLLKGPNPVYAVKLRVRGRVRRILVDARTAQIVGE